MLSAENTLDKGAFSEDSSDSKRGLSFRTLMPPCLEGCSFSERERESEDGVAEAGSLRERAARGVARGFLLESASTYGVNWIGCRN